MSNVLILMSTYNGEKYVAEQIESIISQQEVEIQLLIRDDGSTDSTVSILKKYECDYSNIKVLAENNLGCKQSFYKLCQWALEYPNFDFYAFADQDDVWLQDKISTAVVNLEHFQKETSNLYCSTYHLVDANLNLLLSPKRKFKLTYGESVLIQVAPGCTMVFNRCLLELFCKADPSVMTLHDSWMYKVCLSVGGNVFFDTTPHILYRQHSQNVVGGNQSFFKRWHRRWIYFRSKQKIRSTLIKNIYSIYSKNLTTEALELSRELLKYETSLKSKIKILFSKKLTTYSLCTNLLFRIAILSNRF